jgi:hypothetical protein
MLKTLMVAFVLSALTVTEFAVVAQAHHKVGHCIPGIFSVGCPVTPQAPPMPKPGR